MMLGGAIPVLRVAAKRWRLFVSLAAAAGSLWCVAGAYAGSKPVISGLSAVPATVVSGGTTTVTASVSDAASCTLSANKEVPGLPVTFSCESGSVSQEVVMPKSTGKKAAKYKLTLSATGVGGEAKGKLTVSVSVAIAIGVAAGERASCALFSSGHVKCWGLNEFGELGNGGKGKKHDTPVEVDGITNAVEVDTGGQSGCALLASGHVDCWGRNDSGQVGDGTFQNKSTPAEVQGISNATQVEVGGESACALLATEHVECWGANRFSQLGVGMTGEELASSDVPLEVRGVSDASYLSGKSVSVCAVLTDGHVDCWGNNSHGQLGDGNHEEGGEGAVPGQATPVVVEGVEDAVQVSMNGANGCVLLATGHAACWGANWAGQLGTGSKTGPETCGEFSCSTVPVEVQGVSTAAQVAIVQATTCVLLSGGRVECRGENSVGLLGIGKTEREEQDSLTPVEPLGIAGTTQLAGGWGHICALLAGGHIRCWGAGEYGEIGDGRYGEATKPAEVVGI
jgi:alpha-tubulin suppressor-like RCC1 family protein